MQKGRHGFIGWLIPILSIVIILVIFYLFYWEMHFGVDSKKHVHNTFYFNMNQNNGSIFFYNKQDEDNVKWLDRSTSVGYRDYGDGTCPDNSFRDGFMKLIKKWMKIAEEYNVRYFLDAGTLLGAWRDEEVIPYDLDVDMGVHIDDLTSIAEMPLRLRTLVFNPLADYNFHLAYTANWTLPYHKRTMFNCQGKYTPRYVDECSFIDPMARLIYQRWHIDLYPYYEGDATHFKYLPNRKQISFKKSDFFPLVKCKYGGVVCRCPKDPRPLLKSLYSNLAPEKKCKNKKWV